MSGPEQGGGADVVGPGLPVEPAQQREVAGLAGKVGVAVAAADLSGVLPAHGELGVADDGAGVGDLELAGQGDHDGRGDGAGIGQERPDGPQGDELGGEAQAGRLPGAAPGQADVRLAQVTPAAQPVPLDVLWELAVGRGLGCLSDGDRHGVAAFGAAAAEQRRCWGRRHSWRRSGGGRWTPG